MRSILALITIPFCIQIQAQTPAILWKKNYGGTENDHLVKIRKASDGGFISSGYSHSSSGDVSGNAGFADAWILKTSSAGAIQWKKSFGGTYYDAALDICEMSDGGFCFAGYSYSSDGTLTSNYGSADVWIGKTDSFGNLLWQKSFGGPADDMGRSLQPTADGGIICIGQTASSADDVSMIHGEFDVWLLKLDALGNKEWEKTFGDSLTEIGYSVLTTGDGGYLLSAKTNSHGGQVSYNHGGYDTWILKVDSLGNIVWEKTYGLANDELDTYLAKRNENSFLVVSSSHIVSGNPFGNHGKKDVMVMELDSMGNAKFTKMYGGTDNEYGNSIEPTSDNGFIVSSYSISDDGDITFSYGNNDYWIFKCDSLGTIEWQKNFGGTITDVGTYALETNDAKYLICGYTNSTNYDISSPKGGYDGWVAKLDIVPTGITEYVEREVKFFPNPVNKIFNIKADFPIKWLSIKDISGKTYVTHLCDNPSVTIDVEQLPPGLYVCSVIDDKLQFHYYRFMVIP